MERFKFLASSEYFMKYIKDLDSEMADISVLSFKCFAGKIYVDEIPFIRPFHIEANKNGTNTFQLYSEDLPKIVKFLSSFSDCPILVIPYDTHLTFSDITI